MKQKMKDVLHINNKCVNKGGWDIVWVFSRKEDNSGNVTIIIFVAKTNTLPAHGAGAETFLLSFKGGGNYPLFSIFKECSSLE